jgi:hypothetical protein
MPQARHFVIAYMQRSPAGEFLILRKFQEPDHDHLILWLTEIRLTNFEMTLPRLLHLIALHPDFSMELESLKDTSE